MFTHLYQQAKRSYNNKRKQSAASLLPNAQFGDTLLEDQEENNNANLNDQNKDKSINYIDLDA